MSAPAILLVATTNAHKAGEIASILQLEGYDLVDLETALGEAVAACEETGSTFAANALQKARYYAALSGLPTLADDSGLVVDALDGAPGVHSARWHGETTPYAVKNARLVELLAGVPDRLRTARFVCAAAFVSPDGTEICVEGHHEGSIAHAPSGTAGFGYDPIFVSASEGASFADLPAERKNAVSHRGRALQALRTELVRLPAFQASQA